MYRRTQIIRRGGTKQISPWSSYKLGSPVYLTVQNSNNWHFSKILSKMELRSGLRDDGNAGVVCDVGIDVETANDVAIVVFLDADVTTRASRHRRERRHSRRVALVSPPRALLPPETDDEVGNVEPISGVRR